jgi:GWxTD domain-containing protein
MNSMNSTMRSIAVAALAAMVAVGAFAALSPQYADFGKGPAQWIMTKEEAAKWKTITSDDDAKAFIDLFWARRDPTPTTAVNEYRDTFEGRVKYADDHFTTAKIKGSMSDRGKILIAIGPPTRVQKQSNAPQSTHNYSAQLGDSGTGGDTARVANRQAWIYEREKAPDMKMTTPTIEIGFTDQFGNEDWKFERGGKSDPGVVSREMIQRSITSPDLTVAPTYAAAAPAAAAPAAMTTTPAPAAPLNMTSFKTPALQSAIADFRAAKTNPYEKTLFVTWGEFITGRGDYFVPVELYVPKSAGLAAGADLTFFGVVDDASGTPVAVFEEPAKLQASKDDLYFDKSLSLPAGKFRGTFGLAQAGKPVAIATTDMTLAGTIDKSAPAVSGLIMSNNIFPLAVAQNPNDPYAFGGLKVIPKGDRTFSKSDELWYFFELRNPGMGEAQKPSIQVKVDLEGTTAEGKKVTMSSPPAEASLIELKGVPGHYGVGSSLDLSGFKPGSYTLKVKVTDTNNKQSYNLQETFKVQG